MMRPIERARHSLLMLLFCASCGAQNAATAGPSGVLVPLASIADTDAGTIDAAMTAQDANWVAGPETTASPSAVSSKIAEDTDIVNSAPQDTVVRGEVGPQSSAPQAESSPGRNRGVAQEGSSFQGLAGRPQQRQSDSPPLDVARCDLRHPARFTRITERHRGWFDAVKESLHEPCPNGGEDCDGPSRCSAVEDPISVGRWVIAERGEIQVEFDAQAIKKEFGKDGLLGRLDIAGRIVRRDGSAPAIEVPGYSEINMKAGLGDDEKARESRVEANVRTLTALISEFKYNQDRAIVAMVPPSTARLEWLLVRVLSSGQNFGQLADDLSVHGEGTSNVALRQFRAMSMLGATLATERPAIQEAVLDTVIAATREVFGAAVREYLDPASRCVPPWRDALTLCSYPQFTSPCTSLSALREACASGAKADARAELAKAVHRALTDATDQLRSQALKPQWLSEAAAACVADARSVVGGELPRAAASLTSIPIVTATEGAFLDQVYRLSKNDSVPSVSIRQVIADQNTDIGNEDLVGVLRDAWNERAVAGMRDIRLQPSQLGAKRGDIIELTISYVPFGARSSASQQPSAAGGGASGTATVAASGDDGALGETRPSRWIIQFPVDRKGLYIEPDARLSLVSSWDYQPKAATNHGAIGATTIGVGLDARWYMSPYDSRLERFAAFLVSGFGLGVDTLHFQTNSGTEFGIEGHIDLICNPPTSSAS